MVAQCEACPRGLWGEEVYDRFTRRLIVSYIEQNKTGTKMRGGVI